MKPLWYRLFFRNAGKPRGWTRVILFRSDRTARPLFYRVIHKKSGAVRPHWAYWVADSLPLIEQSQAYKNGAPPPNYSETVEVSAAERTLSELRPFDQTVADWRRNEPAPDFLPYEAIVDRLAAAGSKGLVLSASHDNYRAIPGGVQLCIQREEQEAIARGLDYLQFHPWQPLPCLATVGDGSDLPVTLLLNGEMIGTTSMSTLTAAVAARATAECPVRMVVHHLLGHSPEAIVALARAARVSDVPFWLHDFFTLCPSYTLQRNRLVFCGAPSADSNACELCVFGPARTPHHERIAAFFQALPIRAVAPSQVTADFWSEKSDLPVQGMTVVPHITVEERVRVSIKQGNVSGPITVAYLGAAVAHKGWLEFTQMMNRYSSPEMRFIVCSDKRPGIGEDNWERVHVTIDTPDAMSRTIARANVDVVLHWASWPETFSFTTFEALSAGAWVITNPISGNVQATVRSTGRGVVLDDVTALDRMFADGSLARLVAKRRSSTSRTEILIRYSALSFDLPGWT